MKLLSTSLLLPVLLASAVSSRSLFKSSVSSQDALISEEFPVPGKQPLEFCHDPKDYILEVNYVDLSPNPPVPGEKLIITANGTFHETIEEGATVHLQVRYGLITLINQEADLCENLPKVGIECPIKKGSMAIVEEVDIPRQVPPGKYTVLADVNTVDKRAITCMKAAVVFHR